MADPNQGQLIASTYEEVYPKDPVDNITNSNALMKALEGKGFKRSAPGGRLFECPLEFALNSNMQMVGESQELDTTRVSVFDCARYDPKICAGTISYTELQKLQNSGDDRKIDLVAGLIENGRKSHISLLNTQSWNTVAPSTMV